MKAPFRNLLIGILFILSIIPIFLIFKFLRVISRQEIKREIVGKSYVEGQPDRIATTDTFTTTNLQIVKLPDTYYLIVKIYYDNNDIVVDYISVDKETYNKN